MKKAGSSNSKSKTRRTSKNTRPTKTEAEFSPDLAIGHSPAASEMHSPQDESLIRAFQANLLSLISHELRTPLMGILNSLSLLEDPDASSDFTAPELIKMARQNAQRLYKTMQALLDLASLESGTFHARLREVDLPKIAQSRIELHESSLHDKNLKLEQTIATGAPLLGDPRKLGRAVDLCFEGIIPRAEAGSVIQLYSAGNRVSFTFELTKGTEKSWDFTWTHALAGYESGVGKHPSLFAGVLQSEEAFLTRMEEGLGSEFILVQEIMQLHGGKLSAKRDGKSVTLTMELKELSSEEGLRAVLISRAFQVSHELGSVALVLVQIPDDAIIGSFKDQIKKNLFRASDAVYVLPESRQLAIVLDDCKTEDAPRLMARIQKALAIDLYCGVAQCPSDGLDPGLLYDLASKRLEEALTPWQKK